MHGSTSGGTVRLATNPCRLSKTLTLSLSVSTNYVKAYVDNFGPVMVVIYKFFLQK